MFINVWQCQLLLLLLREGGRLGGCHVPSVTCASVVVLNKLSLFGGFAALALVMQRVIVSMLFCPTTITYSGSSVDSGLNKCIQLARRDSPLARVALVLAVDLVDARGSQVARVACVL